MPVLSIFFGIVITMYWREHNLPHFHAAYGDAEVIVSIETLEVLRGSFPRRASVMVLEWAAEHRAELMENWRLCQAFTSPQPIAPLE